MQVNRNGFLSDHRKAEYAYNNKEVLLSTFLDREDEFNNTS